MKQLLTLLCAFFLFNISIAQTVKNKTVLNQQGSLVNALLNKQVRASIRNEKSATTERVVGQSTRDNSAASIADSMKLTYPLNGISSYDFNQMLYAYNYPYTASPMFNYLGTYTKPQVEFSSFKHWTIDPNTLVYGFYEKDLASYDLNVNMVRDTALYADSSFIPNMTYMNKFSAANNIDTGYWYNYSGGVSTNKFRQYFKFNASNDLVKDSTYEYHYGVWRIVSKTNYIYDVSNNLIQIDNYSNTSDTSMTMPLKEQAKYLNTYDASNRLLTVQTSYYDSVTLVPSVKDTFAYTGTSTFHTSWKQYQYDKINAVWAPIIHMYKTLNAAGFPTTVYTDGYDTFANVWYPSIKDFVTYDSYNNPVKIYDYIYNFTAFPPSPNFTTTYYYESFTITTSANEIPESDSKIQIYPNPSSGSITISGIDTKTKEAIISLFDMQGKMLSRENISLQNGTTKFSNENLIPGIYLMMIQDGLGNNISKQKVIKLN